MEHQENRFGKFEPTKSELEILQVLWEYGPSTVRFVNDKLSENREIKYTSTLKLMQIMVDKSILKRDQSHMTHVYHVAEAEEKTKRFLLQRFVDSIYKGSATNLVLQLLGNSSTSVKEREEIKALLKKLDQQK
ncbi:MULTISPECIES: BlaI/MecI/CopY family transcriptional regulator [Pedobacter]|uniref:BlaI/MecI/CopY family transcriptional regulator n=1 Tax=Pedobacter TaxID=84567 RepID=UPI00210EDE7F|nr:MULTISPECIES: BlaI/MecI/CopY family transcriptional regulator [unclassified Pedobacter]